MIEHQLAEFFTADAAILARTAERIFPGRAIHGTRGEVIVIQDITGQPIYTIDLEAGIADKVVQVDCYSSSPRAAYTLAELVRDRLSGYRGTIGTTTPVLAQSCRIISSGQEVDQPTDSSDRWIHRYRLDFALFVATSIPTF